MKIIMIGNGNTVYFLARVFMHQKHHVAIIHRDWNESRDMSRRLGTVVLFGEGAHPKMLEQAGAMSTDVLLALTDHDHDNLIACQIAIHQFDIPRTIALVNNPDNEVLFRKLGISVAFSATRILAGLLEAETGVMAITDMMSLAQGKIHMMEYHLPEDSPVAGQSLMELQLPPDCLITAIIRNEDVLVPRGATLLQAGDRLILMARTEAFDDLFKRLDVKV
jgi:trk system potassium uptake protein TrkA